MLLAFYNGCWRTRLPESGQIRAPTAVAAGVVKTFWSFEDLFDRMMGAQSSFAA